MIRRPPRSTRVRSSAASDVYKRQVGASPIGQTITAEGVVFEIVGVAKAKGSIFGQSQDNFLIIPINTYFKIWGARSGMGFAATALDHDHLAQAQEEARMPVSYTH